MRPDGIQGTHGLATATAIAATKAGKAFSGILKETLSARPTENAKAGLVSLGTVTHETPTVSDLLIHHPAFGRETWRIVHAEVNRDKPFTRIPAGTEIHIDPTTKEILWGGAAEKRAAELAGKTAETKTAAASGQTEDEPLAERLIAAVRPYMGKPYDYLDCYGLVIRGLKDIGVKYMGDGGLKDRLQTLALGEGLPKNAYLTGEGLIGATGRAVFSRTVNRVSDYGEEAFHTLREMLPHLEKGHILSFSTPTSGHMGIISNESGGWTFINSGKLDNPVGSIDSEKAVGEEYLSDEVVNWFKRAQERNESLKITLGALAEEKLTAFRGATETSEKA